MSPPTHNKAGIPYRTPFPAHCDDATTRQARLWLLWNPRCAYCGTNRYLRVHHIVPVSVDPGRRLDLTNLITLCHSPGRECHRIRGHFGNWSLYNPDIVAHCAAHGGPPQRTPGTAP
jgi:hypothetical protein